MWPTGTKARGVPELEIIAPGIGPVNIVNIIILCQVFCHGVICRLQAAVKLHLRKNNYVLIF